MLGSCGEDEVSAPLLIVVLLLGSVVEARAQVSLACKDSQTQEQVRKVVLEGIDQGLRNQTVRVFDIWMKDASEQPKRALTGMDAAISAYVRARANALKWSPPLCSGDKQ
jgi:hypothetical protein